MIYIFSTVQWIQALSVYMLCIHFGTKWFRYVCENFTIARLIFSVNLIFFFSTVQNGLLRMYWLSLDSSLLSSTLHCLHFMITICMHRAMISHSIHLYQDGSLPWVYLMYLWHIPLVSKYFYIPHEFVKSLALMQCLFCRWYWWKTSTTYSNIRALRRTIWSWTRQLDNNAH